MSKTKTELKAAKAAMKQAMKAKKAKAKGDKK